MAFLKIPGQGPTLPKYAQGTLTPITGGGNYKIIPVTINHIPQFAQTSISPITGGSHYKPVPPLPGTGSTHVGGQFGFSF